MSEPKKILAVLAHPDDESFGMGGTLALYAKQGVEVHLVCATKGEAGEMDPEFLQDYGSIAERREAELRCAADVLGMKNVYFLGYRDSGMEGTEANRHPQAFVNAPMDEVVSKVVHYIRQIRPDVVITFDPVGGYHHPDHIYIHQAAVKAFHAAADPAQYPDDLAPFQAGKLLYHIFPRGFIRVGVRILKLLGKDPTKFGRNNDIDLEMLAGDADYPAHYRINYSNVAELKEKASNCHASQQNFGTQSPWLMRVAQRFTAVKDQFMQAYPEVKDNFRARDLFVGS